MASRLSLPLLGSQKRALEAARRGGLYVTLEEVHLLLLLRPLPRRLAPELGHRRWPGTAAGTRRAKHLRKQNKKHTHLSHSKSNV